MMAEGVTRLLDLRGETTPPAYRVPVEHFPLADLRDGQHEMLLAAARRVQVLAAAGETVGIYCQAGVSRTAAVAILYLMLSGLSRADAARVVRERRPEAHPAAALDRTLDDLAVELLSPTHVEAAFTVNIDGVRVAGVHRKGPGAPLILLHGAYGDWTHWRRNLDQLATAADVYAIDLPGFGDSDDVPGDFSHKAYLKLLGRAIRTLVTPPVVLGGYSFGASLAARLAIADPDLVRALLLVSLVGRTGDPATHHRVDERHFVHPSSLEDRLAVLADNLRRWHVADPSVVDDRLVAMTYKSVFFTRLSPRRLRATPNLMPMLEVVERLSGIPALMVWGEGDAFCQPSVAEWAAACARVLPGVAQRVIARAAHFCQWEQPDAFFEAVRPILTAWPTADSVAEGEGGGGV
jgi:pimeloyl-ACP methyl ester carboxylesterase